MNFKERIRSIYKGGIIGRKIIFLHSTSSTNDVAFEIGQKPDIPEGTVVVADSQTQGRGRMGRQWISPPDRNLYFTVLLSPAFSPQESQLISLMAATASASAIRNHAQLKADIKWPNDILINNRKVGGILTESRIKGSTISLIALGIGINVNMTPDELGGLSTIATSLMIEKGSKVDRVLLLGKILNELEYYYKILLDGNKRALINDWLRLNSTIGNYVRIRSGEETIDGYAEGITENGELIVRKSSGELRDVHQGEITLIKHKNEK
jgi:BirA family biotin operon repressor/biotin-[acetyl-CoA-carboxylase] ligase